MPPPDSVDGNPVLTAPSFPGRSSRLAPPTVADLEHPWLGLESFGEETGAYFFGRAAEVAEIHLRLRNQPLLVVFGQSGFGKTSILSAGLIPRLRREGHRPAIHRLSYGPDDPNPVDQLLSHLSVPDAIRAVPFALPDDAASRLWLHLHRNVPWPGVTHLVLDQFEEVFTVDTQRPGAVEDVREALGILIRGAVPEPIARCLETEETFSDYFDSDSQPVWVILAVRADYVYALNRWQRHLPQLGQNSFELRALRGSAALDAVYKPGLLRTCKREENGTLVDADTGLPPIVSEDTARRIVRRVAEKKEDVPFEEIEATPSILSLLCRELNERRYRQPTAAFNAPSAEIVYDEETTNLDPILETFYERCVADRPAAVRISIEEDLVSRSGVRLQNDERSIIDVFANGREIPGDEKGRHALGYDSDRAAATDCLRELVKLRLLTPAAGGENPRYELSHDLLCSVVHKRRMARQERLEKERLKTLLSLKNNPAAGLAHGYYGNFVRPVVTALLSQDVTIKDQDPGVASIPEGRPIDNAAKESRSALKLFVIIPASFAIGESLTKTKIALKHVTLRSSLANRSFYVDALSSGGNYQLVDISSGVSGIKLWAHRQSSEGRLDPESDEALQIESDALETFESVLNWWIEDPANNPEFSQRVKVFRATSNIPTAEELAKTLDIQ
jgi:hypothetical protein